MRNLAELGLTEKDLGLTEQKKEEKGKVDRQEEQSPEEAIDNIRSITGSESVGLGGSASETNYRKDEEGYRQRAGEMLKDFSVIDSFYADTLKLKEEMNTEESRAPFKKINRELKPLVFKIDRFKELMIKPDKSEQEQGEAESVKKEITETLSKLGPELSETKVQFDKLSDVAGLQIPLQNKMKKEAGISLKDIQDPLGERKNALIDARQLLKVAELTPEKNQAIIRKVEDFKEGIRQKFEKAAQKVDKEVLAKNVQRYMRKFETDPHWKILEALKIDVEDANEIMTDRQNNELRDDLINFFESLLDEKETA